MTFPVLMSSRVYPRISLSLVKNKDFWWTKRSWKRDNFGPKKGIFKSQVRVTKIAFHTEKARENFSSIRVLMFESNFHILVNNRYLREIHIFLRVEFESSIFLVCWRQGPQPRLKDLRQNMKFSPFWSFSHFSLFLYVIFDASFVQRKHQVTD